MSKWEDRALKKAFKGIRGIKVIKDAPKGSCSELLYFVGSAGQADRGANLHPGSNSQNAEYKQGVQE